MKRTSLLVSVLLCTATVTQAGEIFHYAQMNTREIAALDAARTVVLVPGGILEQHDPYLPSGSDTIMSEHATQALADSIVRETDRDVLMLPTIHLGSDGANVIGERAAFPGTLTVHPETLRQVYMDLGDALAEAGFRNIFLVHIHGAPRQNLALDMASDYFNETWGGTMVHLYGLLPVQEQWHAARQVMSEQAIAAQGYSVHSSAVEHSAVMYLQPDAVSSDVADAPDWRADDHPGMVALAHKPEWPGYFGAPRHVSRAAGKAVMDAVEEQMIDIALAILDGADVKRYPRFSVVSGAAGIRNTHSEQQRKRQAAWLGKQGK